MAIKDYIGIEHPLRTKWQGVYNSMVVHTQDALPEKLFRERRPLESQNDAALSYRLDNYRNVVKSTFDLAIEQYIEAANNIEAVISIGEATQAYLNDYTMFDGYKETTVKDWLFNFVGRYKQTDPNSFVVVLPMHPTYELVASYDAELPNFSTAANMPPKPVVWLVPYNDVTYVTDKELMFKAGSWVLDAKGNTEPYYFHMTGEQITLVYPVRSSDTQRRSKVDYIEYPWYAANYNNYTAYVTGSKAIIWSDKNGDIYQYYVSDFFGAAQIADKLVGNLSDLDIIEARFTHPHMWMVKKECDAVGCHQNFETGRYEVNGKVCQKCGGVGYIKDTSPLGTFLLDSKDDFSDTGAPKLPVGFVTPDTAILKHKAERTENYYHWMTRELGLNVSQNMTNASGESKRYDMMQKVTLISGIVVDLYRLLENIYSAIAHYIGDDQDVVISLPKDFDIKNADDISDELKMAKEANLPYAVLVELTKRYMLSKFGHNEKTKRKVDYLASNDKLFVYGIDDLKNAIAIHGTDITNRDKIAHIMGWQILTDILKDDAELSDEQIDTLFTEAVESMLPTPSATANTLL